MSKAADGSEQRQTLVSSLLEKGERVGFTRDGQGRLLGVAGGGDPEVLAADGNYLWEVQAETGVDSRKTALLVAGLVVVGAAIVIGALYWAMYEGLEDEDWTFNF